MKKTMTTKHWIYLAHGVVIDPDGQMWISPARCWSLRMLDGDLTAAALAKRDMPMVFDRQDKYAFFRASDIVPYMPEQFRKAFGPTSAELHIVPRRAA